MYNVAQLFFKCCIAYPYSVLWLVPLAVLARSESLRLLEGVCVYNFIV